MNTAACALANGNGRYDGIVTARTLAARFAPRVAAGDETAMFAVENYADLKEAGFFAVAVPAELGGGGASYEMLCRMLRELAQGCSATALALAMHTHQVAVAAWRWRHTKAPVEDLLRRVADEQIVLVGSGGSGWLASSGHMKKVDGGYRVTARKMFVVGAPVGDLLMTSGVLAEAGENTVLHFWVPLRSGGVWIMPTWGVLGMRATGSHDVVLDNVFVPDNAVTMRRPQGQWHPLYDVRSMLALPTICSVYVGIADAARAIALKLAGRRRESAPVQHLVGEMENEWLAAQLALQAMIDRASGDRPGADTSSAIFSAKTLATRAALRTVEKAMEVAASAGSSRDSRLERLCRDAQAARYQPLQEKAQHRFTGRFALGLEAAA